MLASSRFLCSRSATEQENQVKPSNSSKMAVLLAIAIVSAGAALVSAQQPAPAHMAHDAAYYAFRSAATEPPKNSDTPVFHLSKDYPHQPPRPLTEKCPQDECPWLYINVNFKPQFPTKDNPIQPPSWHGQGWDTYLAAILKYVREGQTDDLNNQDGWRIQVNGKTRWYNVPWMAYDPTAGREYVHGTTNERTAGLAELIGPTHSPHPLGIIAGESEDCRKKYPFGFESWSVGYYNAYGGYSLGRSIPATGVPQLGEHMGSLMPAGLPFPEGTMVVKILTSSVPAECITYLKNSPAWQVDRHKYSADKGYQCEREVQISHVVQVDVAVADSRSPIGWVYGTFAYDGDTPGTTFWDHLVPLGLQWGSDPWTFPAVPRTVSLPIQQSVINPDVDTFQHLGCQDRLAGPVDNPQSSCTSCHASAYAVAHGALNEMGTNVPPSFGFAGMCQEFSQNNSDYFQNQAAPQGFPGGLFPNAISLDTSLQMAVAFTQYGVYHTNHEPDPCTDPNQIKPAPHRVAAFAAGGSK
jgi:hypothetical protein